MNSMKKVPLLGNFHFAQNIDNSDVFFNLAFIYDFLVPVL